MKWQTDITKPLCVDWTNHFYNTDLRDDNSNVLHPIRKDNGSLEINDQYEQSSGLLNIQGTPNVMGITDFQVIFLYEFNLRCF